MKEKLTPHIKTLAEQPAIARQYLIGDDEKLPGNDLYSDPLLEEEHEVVKGLVHKYTNRALIKVSYLCAAHCRFCTRIRQIGDPAGTLSENDIENIYRYLTDHSEIDDVILSGGDPFYTGKVTTQLLEKLDTVTSIKVMRIGTRMPLQSPESFDTATVKKLMEVINNTGANKPFYILLHINHPGELTAEVLGVISKLRSLNVTLLSQTVFLRGVNDTFETLSQLYTQLYHAGIIPYYLYHCDAVNGIQHFSVAIEKEKEIVTRLTTELSGIACPTYVMDIQNGHGKIPVPLNFIDTANKTLIDFRGVKHEL